MPLEVKDLTISLPSGEPVAENISFQIEREKCFRLSEVQVREKQRSAKRLWGCLVPFTRLRARLFSRDGSFDLAQKGPKTDLWERNMFHHAKSNDSFQSFDTCRKAVGENLSAAP